MTDATTAIPPETPRTAGPAQVDPLPAAFRPGTPGGATPAGSPVDPVRAPPLGYEPPRNRPPPIGLDDVAVMVFRRVAFALGVGLLAYGVLAGFATRNYRDSAAMGGWGAGLIALVVPFPGLWRHWPARRP